MPRSALPTRRPAFPAGRRHTRLSAHRALPVCAVIALLLAGLLPLGWSSANRAEAQESAVPYGDVIVVLTDPRADAARVAGEEGVHPRHVYQNVFRGFSAHITKRRAEHLARHPRVAFITPIEEFRAAAQTLPAGIDRVDADENPVADIDGNDHRVDADIALLDSGIDQGHADLNVAGGVSCTGRNPFDDDRGHGTHVAGIAAAKDNSFGVVGVAPGANLWSVGVLDDAGEGSTDELICGLDWVVAHADTIDVVNMSLASETTDPVAAASDCWEDALHLAICNTVAAGVPVVVAAGNESANASSYVPGAFDEVITVSAFTDFDGQPHAGGPPENCPISSADDCLRSDSNDGPDVDIAAPGTSVYSTLPGGNYGRESGTSMATPHVSGAVALFKAVNPGASPERARAWLLENGAAQTGPDGFGGDNDGFREPALSVGDDIDTAPPPPPGLPFAESSGRVVMEAEHASAFISRDDHGWSWRNSQTDGNLPGYAGDGFVRVEPDAGDHWTSGYAGNAPELQFEVQFSTPGTYYVWLRSQADDGGDDSAHAGVDGSTPSSADRLRPAFDGGSWNWSSRTMDGPRATINIPSAGLHTINLWAREDGYRIDRVLLSRGSSYTPSGTGPAESPHAEEPAEAFVETDGYVEFEAEDFHDRINRSGQDWRFEDNVIGGFSGSGYLRVRCDCGDNWLSNYTNAAPEVRYRVQFSTTGTYYVWARLQATDGADDSMHVGLDGSALSTADRFRTSVIGDGFNWSNQTMDHVVARINIASPGVHTINVWAREDGLRFDRMILTTSASFSPAGGSEEEPPPAFEETGGYVEFEAEDYHDLTGRDGHAWTAASDVSGYSGSGFITVLPNTHDYWTSDYAATSPEADYRVQFSTPGTYYVWASLQADDNGDDSLHVGLDGAEAASARAMKTADFGGDFAWSNETMQGPVATIAVGSAGLHTINVWAREDGLRFDRLILTQDAGFAPAGVAAAQEPTPTPTSTPEPTVTPSPTAEPLPPFSEQGGFVAVEAEHFHAETARGDIAWTRQSDLEGFAGEGFMRAEPDNGVVIAGDYAATSPALAFDVEFAGAGTYYIWVRGLATGEGDDSVHVGVDGQEMASAHGLDLVEDGTWRWTNVVEGGVATIEISNPGVHTITVWMAEDGARIDRLLLTSDAAFVPEGLGPAESPRNTEATATAASPTATATAETSPTATPEPSPTETAVETATPEPTATATALPPTATTAPAPTATSTPPPAPTATVTEEATEAATDEGTG